MKYLRFLIIVILFVVLSGYENIVFSQSPFLMDTTIFYGFSEGSSPALASDGTNFIAVWDDTKRGAIYGCRITNDGELVDSTGFEIASGDYPCIAYNGTNYLVVWQRSEISKNIYASRVTIDGQILDPNGIAICTATGDQKNPKVTSNGSDWLICWEDQRNGTSKDIYGARVNSSGQVLDTDGFIISAASNKQESVSLVFGGNNYFVVWDDSRNSDSLDVYGARINQSGNVLDPSGILVCSANLNQYYPSASFDGTNYFVVWSDDRLQLWFTDIYGTRINQSGTVLDPGGIALFHGTHWEEITAIDFDGTNYLITWEDYRTGHENIYGGRVTPAGIVIDTGGFPICTANESQYNNNKAIAFNGSNFLCVWEDERNNPSSSWHIYAARINTTGNVLDPSNFCISLKANEQFSPAAVFDSTNYFAVWEETKYGTRDIFGAKFNSSGEILPPGIIAICTSVNDQKNPSISFDGTNYFVVWQDNRNGSNYGIYGARVNQSGVVLDLSSIAIHWGGYSKEYPDIAFDGTNYFIVYQTYRSGYNREIYGIRVSPSGTILTPSGFDISLSNKDEYEPKVAFDGSNFFVVWYDNRNTNFGIYGCRVDSSGTLIDSTGIQINPIGIRPILSYYGNNYFVVWEKEINTQEFQIFGARVDTSGSVLDAGTNISNMSVINSRPSIANDGSKFVIIWEKYPYGEYSECDLRGAWVNSSGIVINSFNVSNESKKQNNPYITYGASNQFLITYEGWCTNYLGKSYNTSKVWGKYADNTVSIYEKNPVEQIPSDYHLEQNYPNPFNPSTTIRYELPVEGFVTIQVYDILGREIETLVNKELDAGKFNCTFNASDLASGIYMYKINVKGIDGKNYSEAKKMLLMK